MELNPDTDLTINTADLTSEFKDFPIVMYRYMQMRAKMEARRDIAKATLKEKKALAYKRIKMDVSIKHTEKSMEAEIDTHLEVVEANLKLIQTEHDASTWGGAVESMRAKMNSLIQLGADSRKER